MHANCLRKHLVCHRHQGAVPGARSIRYCQYVAGDFCGRRRDGSGRPECHPRPVYQKPALNIPQEYYESLRRKSAGFLYLYLLFFHQRYVEFNRVVVGINEVFIQGFNAVEVYVGREDHPVNHIILGIGGIGGMIGRERYSMRPFSSRKRHVALPSLNA